MRFLKVMISNSRFTARRVDTIDTDNDGDKEIIYLVSQGLWNKQK